MDVSERAYTVWRLLVHVLLGMGLASWPPPPAGCLKLNADAAYVELTTLCGIGAVVRDNEEAVMATFTRREKRVSSMLLAE
ncbi:conserved hypothetical protein [Ricinus communis]|uniref:Reverse transcriptase/retrotransposon-derived protein RNase H-like domain-containing protein n=1 Tax=Ricinus communis TaxID=3988 RepID=B9RVQ2_RICCO|nr:conserved hypothetical protein [Ricinus communis]